MNLNRNRTPAAVHRRRSQAARLAWERRKECWRRWGEAGAIMSEMG